MNTEEIKNTSREFQARNGRKFKNTQAEFEKDVSYKKSTCMYVIHTMYVCMDIVLYCVEE